MSFNVSMATCAGGGVVGGGAAGMMLAGLVTSLLGGACDLGDHDHYPPDKGSVTYLRTSIYALEML